MATISKEQVKQIIQNAPQGSSPEGIVAALRQQGHQLEGFSGESIEQRGKIAEIESQPAPLGGFLQGAAKFLGAEPLTRRASQFLFEKFTPEGRELTEREAQGLTQSGEVEAIRGERPTGKQLLGSAAQTGLSLGTLGAGAAVRAGATAGARIAGTAGRAAGLGALSGGITGFAEDGDASDIFKGAALGGVLGGALGGVFGSVGEGLKALTRKVPTTLFNTAIKPALDESRKAIKFQGETLGEELVRRGITGSDRKLLNTAKVNLNQAEDRLQSILTKSTGTIERKDLVKHLDRLIKTKEATPGLSNEIEVIKNVLQEFPEKVTLAEANVIKRNLFTALKDVAFRLDPSLSGKREAMKALSLGIKDEIEKKVGGNIVRNINKDLSVFSRLEDRIIDKIARKERNNLLSLGNIATAAAGGAGAGLPGAIGAVVLRDILGSTAVKTNAAVALDRIGQALDNIPTDQAGRISRVALIRAIEEAVKSIQGGQQTNQPTN